jgi:hypothetical protein
MTSDNSPKIKVVDKHGEVAKSDHSKHEEGVNDIAIMNVRYYDYYYELAA